MLSVVIPVFDEEAVLPALRDRLRAVLDAVGEAYEVIFVDDGSRDASPALLDAIAAEWPHVRVIHLARNAGHQLALTAGLDVAAGDWVATLDADLQDPPELLPQMLELGRRGVDVVYARRSDRGSDSWLKRTTATAYYALIRRVTKVDVPRHVGDYRLLSRRVVEALRMLPERHRVYRVLIPWLGFRSAVVDHRRDARAAGRTKYSTSRMALLAADSVTSFSSTPLRAATLLGLGGAAVCFVLAVTAVVAEIIGGTVPGWASIVVGMLFLGAVQLVFLGVLGEYVGRIFDEVKRRPLYIVERDSGPPQQSARP